MASAPASVGAWLRQRVDKVRRWKDVLGRLGGVWGSTPAGQQLLQEIFDKGPDGGTELGEELLRNPGELQQLMQLQGEAAYFGMFSVRPEQQGNGIGHRLLAEAERIAGEEWGCREMRMTVIDVREELLAWYLRRGYQRTGEYKPFPYGDERFGIPKRPDLRF